MHRGLEYHDAGASLNEMVVLTERFRLRRVLKASPSKQVA